MNPTIQKFGYPATLIKEFEHWIILLRPAQVTLGSLILVAKADATAFAALPPAAFLELAEVVQTIEDRLSQFTRYERINYLMLMMIDPNVHFHVIPRYSKPRTWKGFEIADVGWPGAPRLDAAVKLDDAVMGRLAIELMEHFGQQRR